MHKTILIFLTVVLILCSFSIFFANFSENFAKKTISIDNHLKTTIVLTPYNPFFYVSFFNKENSVRLTIFSKDYCNGIVLFNNNDNIEKIYLFHNSITFSPDILKIRKATLDESAIYQLLQ